MINVYDKYKPLRNALRTLEIESVLQLVRRKHGEVDSSGRAAIQDRCGSAIGIVFNWELHLLAREAMLHAGRDPWLRRADRGDLIPLVNHIRRITEEISKRAIDSGERAMKSLHTLMHQQARWQNPRDWDRLYRAHRVYGSQLVRDMFEAIVGTSLPSMITMAFATAGQAARVGVVDAAADYSGVGVTQDERDAYFAMVGASYSEAREALSAAQRYDEGWSHTWNYLEAKPLVCLWDDRPKQFLCPIPELVLRRVTEGLFYDLAKSGAKYGNAYGLAFQDYVGDVLTVQFKRSSQKVMAEEEYRVKRDRKDGVDWIVSDATGHLMIECKTRRMRLDAKITPDSEHLTETLSDLADSIVQHYRNVHDALECKTAWKPDGLPVYPILVTYEDWYLFAPHVVEYLDTLVLRKLTARGLQGLLEESPYTVTSIAEFEKAGQAIAHVGVGPYFAERVKRPHRHFGLSAFADEAFPEIVIPYDRLFPNNDQEMLSHLRPLMALPSEI